MPTYSFLIGFDEQRLHQFTHDTGAAVRVLGVYDGSWTPASSNFSTVTGLPNSGTIDPLGFSNLCSVAASEELLYAYDPNVCRVVMVDAASGSKFGEFGGRRGIGSGRIEPDSIRRSIVAVGNSRVFVADNAGDFVLQYSLFGTFESEYSISGWASSLSLSFDQVTGWAYDTSRACYWALASGSANVYLLRIDLTGTPTGEVVDLTARLATTLGITVSGHGGTDLGRTETRGLAYNNGALIFTSLGRVIRVDLANTDGDALLRSEANNVGHGSWTSDGTEFSYVLRDQSNGSAVAKVLTIATGSVRSYGTAQSPATGTPGQVDGAWDIAVVPTAEDPSTQTSRTLQLRTRISGTTSRTLQMRAAIAGLITRTIQLRARILNLGLGSQRQIQMRARIEEPFTIPDTVATSWDLEDSLGTFSRGLTIRCASDPGLRAGDTVTLYAGYGTERIRLMRGEIDDISKSLTPDSQLYVLSVRDQGARLLDSKLYTKTWLAQFPRTTNDIPSVTASTILNDIGAPGGFPDYPLYGNFVAHNETALQISQRLAEPWNLFPSRQHYPQVRDSVPRSVEINWVSPPSNGYQIPRSRIKEATIRQTRYLQSPNLTAFTDLIVKGTTVTLSIIDQIGPQTRIEYLRSLTEDSATEPSAGNTGETNFAQEYVLTEQISTETLWGDKVLSRVAETYETRYSASGGGGGGTTLVAREEEETLYFEPPGELGFSSIQTSSAGPSPLALPYQINSVTSAVDSEDGIFKEVQRTQTNHYYDTEFRVAAETTSTTTFDTTLNRWVLDSVQHRTHSETTGGSVRIKRFSFSNDDGNLIFDAGDSQQVGGQRPNPANASGLSSVVTFQAIAPEPQVIVDVFGAHVVDPGGDRLVWSYENAFLGQRECETVRELALAEKGLQDGSRHWEEVQFTMVLDPNLHSGMAISFEVAPGVFKNYWCESANHSFTVDEALTRGTLKRLTTDDLP